MILQADDCRHDIEGTLAGFEFFYFAGDDGFGTLGLYAAVGDVAGDRLLQVIDVVGKDAVELRHVSRDVTRDSDIDEEHGAVLAASEELFAVFPPEDGVRRTR